MTRIHPQIEEAVETLRLPRASRRRLMQGAGLFSASLAASALLAACSNGNGDGNENDSGGAGDFPETPTWRFVFVNHVTANPFFQPTQYGASDACALLGCEFQWTGSRESAIGEMVEGVNSAITAEADGIALSVVDTEAFTQPVDDALDAGVPVVSYNADGAADSPGTNRLAYVGQDLFASGVALGERIADLVEGGPVAGFIATPGQLNIQPRIDGARQAIEQSGKDIAFEQVATGAELPQELATIDAYWQGHQDLVGMLAVDAGSTQGLGEVMEQNGLKEHGIVAGGFDLLEGTMNSINDGHLDFTIDQQPYLQGFLPVAYLYLCLLSGGLVVPPETNTGLSFITADTVVPFLETSSRFQGDSEEQQVLERSGPIPHA